MSKPALKLSRPELPPAPPQDRGRLIDKYEISERFFNGKVSARWCAEHVAPKARKRIAGRFLWRELDVQDWVAQQ